MVVVSKLLMLAAIVNVESGVRICLVLFSFSLQSHSHKLAYFWQLYASTSLCVTQRAGDE